jgi:hypothetical protein
VNIAGKLLAIGILIDQDGPVSALKQVPGSLSFRVIIVGVGPVDVMENLGEIGTWGLKQEMVMVAHQAVGMYQGPVTLIGGF